MKFRIAGLYLSVFAIVCSFNQITTAQVRLSVGDKRHIIKLILDDWDFTDAMESFEDKTPNLSTKNIPKSVQREFPPISGVKFNLLSPEYIAEAKSIYYFSFGRFKVRGKQVYIWFYENYYDGGGRGFENAFQKIKGRWKMVKPKTVRVTAWQT